MGAPSRQPNFFLVGAAKCGTTSLARYLDQHPEVFVCKPKEPNFYALPEGERPGCVGPAPSERLYDLLLKYSVTDRARYEALFEGAGDAVAVGDASVRYLYEPTAAQRIAEQSPDARIVVMLRDPVERMHSHYHMNLHAGVEPLGFRAAVDAEDERVAAGWGWDWHYRRVGQYAGQLRRYVDRFGPERVQVLFQKDLAADPGAVWRCVCGHLGVDASFSPDFSQRALVGCTPRSRWLKRLVWDDNPAKSLARVLLPAGVRRRATEKMNRANVRSIEPLTTATRAELGPLFAEDRAELESLCGREMPW